MTAIPNINSGPSSQFSSSMKQVLWHDGTTHRIRDNLPNVNEVAIYALVGIVALPIIASIGTVVCFGKSLFSAASAVKHHIAQNVQEKNQALVDLKEHASWLGRWIVSLIPGASLMWAAMYLHRTIPHPGNPDVRIRDLGVVLAEDSNLF